MNVKSQSRGEASHLLKEARDLRSRLGHTRTKTKLTIFPGDTPGDDGAKAIGFVVVVTGDDAFKHAEELRTSYGCNCVSSGEAEITCTCPDE